MDSRLRGNDDSKVFGVVCLLRTGRLKPSFRFQTTFAKIHANIRLLFSNHDISCFIKNLNSRFFRKFLHDM